jgi:hypothetical protein
MNTKEMLAMSAEHGPKAPEQSGENQELQKLGSERLDQLAEANAEKPAVDNEKRAEAARETLRKQEVQPEPDSNAGEKSSQASFKLYRYSCKRSAPTEPTLPIVQ